MIYFRVNTMNKIVVLLFLVFMQTVTIDASHFNGGTISWFPVYPNSTSSSVLITITQSYSWVYPKVNCTTNVPPPIGGGGGGGSSSNTTLICVANCSTDGGYSTKQISILTDCISFSPSLSMVNSERSVNITLNAGTYFWIAYRGSAWRTLENAATTSNPGWSIVSLIDLRRRPDGLINTPPEGQVTSPQYMIVNQTSTINIPVSDVNSGDDIRCRWPTKNKYAR